MISRSTNRRPPQARGAQGAQREQGEQGEQGKQGETEQREERIREMESFRRNIGSEGYLLIAVFVF